MKKILTLLLLVVMLTAVLSGCGPSVSQTKSTVRWWLGSHKDESGNWINDTEEYTFVISKADFLAETASGGLFNSYTVNSKTYYRDTPIQARGASETINTFVTGDELSKMVQYNYKNTKDISLR